MPADDIEAFLEAKVPLALQDVVSLLRELVAEAAPAAVEVITYGILGWRQRKVLAVVNPTKKDITLAFSRGAEFEDRYGLLKGAGKVSKHVKVSDVDKVDKDALRYYIRQAVALDAA